MMPSKYEGESRKALKLGEAKPFFNPHEKNKLSTREYLELLALMAGVKERKS